ncbi:MAG: undecaprenyl-diphosphate phosphatase [Clostridia bacterium]
MVFLYAIIFGIVQGLTEFLPVSSSGHLVLVNRIFGGSGNFLFLSVLLHVATLLSVIIVLRKDVKNLICHPFSAQAKKIYLSLLPTIIIVLVFKSAFENAFNGQYLSICFAITGFVLLLTCFFSKRAQTNKPISYKTAFFMGVIQGIAVMPGISRSGSTIACGMLCGESQENATKFSFLMSIPVIFASMGYEALKVFKNGTVIQSSELLPIMIACVFAFFVGMFSIKIMLGIVKKTGLLPFGIYLFVLSILTAIFL